MEDYTVRARVKRPVSARTIVSARPEQLFFGDEGIAGRISISTFLGDFVEYEVQTDDGQTLLLNEYTKDAAGVRPDGERCHVSFDAGGIAVIDPETEEVVSAFGA